jgi:hypothetical protein
VAIWRLVMRGVARYEEIRRYWDINEVFSANERLDMADDYAWLEQQAAAAKAATQARRSGGTGKRPRGRRRGRRR